MTNQTLTLTKLIAFTWEITFSKIKHIHKTMIRSRITYESIIWHEFKKTKLVSQKTINALTIIQNNCLKRIFEVYKTIFIAKLKTKTHISLIDIHLNKLQAKAKTRLQNSQGGRREGKWEDNLFHSHKREGKLNFFSSRSGKWKKNLFSFHKKSLILLILVGKNSFFSDFFSCEKGNSKKSLSFPNAGRKIEKKKSSRIPSLFFAITLKTRDTTKE